MERLRITLRRAVENFLSLESEMQRRDAKQAMDDLEEKLRREELDLLSLVPRPVSVDPEATVRNAVTLLRNLGDFGNSPEKLSAVRRLIELVDARLYLGFEKQTQGKRSLNKVARGVLTFGAAKPPIEVYQGPTARNKLPSYSAEKLSAGQQATDVRVDVSVGKDDSLGNANRGDRI